VTGFFPDSDARGSLWLQSRDRKGEDLTAMVLDATTAEQPRLRGRFGPDRAPAQKDGCRTGKSQKIQAKDNRR
jgi:hypothetical protein